MESKREFGVLLLLLAGAAGFIWNVYFRLPVVEGLPDGAKDFALPKGVSATIEKNNIVKLSSIDRQLLGQTAARIRQLRPPEPYKGKGIKYAEERIQRKAGKTGTK